MAERPPHRDNAVGMNRMRFLVPRTGSIRVAGLMSGTSADGVTAVIVEVHRGRVSLLSWKTYPYPAWVRKALFRLFDSRTGRIDELCRMNVLLGELFADALLRLARESGVPTDSIHLIGSHGQTVCHLPRVRRLGAFAIRATLQIAEPCVIAERTGVPVVADFRPRDMAVGGQGAPLVPLADYLLFRHRWKDRAVQNIGGIANVTWLPAGCSPGDVIAFDTGPGNMIIDCLAERLTNGRQRFDRDGRLAARGIADRVWLRELMRHAYFRQRPPKSTGRETFGTHHAEWVLQEGRRRRLSPEDIMATATALTAESIADACRRFLPRMPAEMIVAGGGSHNRVLVRMLAEAMQPTRVALSDEFGIPADAREAVSFALLALESVHGRPGNVPSATGATRRVVLGKIIPGRGALSGEDGGAD